MDDLIDSFNKLCVSDKTIVTNIIKQNDNIDDLINGLQELTIDNSNNTVNNIIQNTNTNIISNECKKVISKMINYFSILNNKKRCFFKVNHESPKWCF